MKALPIILGVVGLALFGSAWLVPADPTGRLSLLMPGAMLILLAYTLSLERAFREEVKCLEGRLTYLEGKRALQDSRTDRLQDEVQRLQNSLFWTDIRLRMLENLSSTDKGEGA